MQDTLCLYQLCSIPVGCMWSGFPSLFCPRDPYWLFSDSSEESCELDNARCNDMTLTPDACGDQEFFCGVCEPDGTCWPLVRPVSFLVHACVRVQGGQ